MRFTGGLPETECGFGSTLRATESIRRQLPARLREMAISSLLDAPCGDCNWISQTDLGHLEYIGVDNNPLNLSRARGRMPHGKFWLRNLLLDDIPVADAVLCRDFLQHLPTKRAATAMRRLVHSGCSWFMATSHLNEHNDDIDQDGQYRPLNLFAPPFSLPPPEWTIADTGHLLCAWWQVDQVYGT